MEHGRKLDESYEKAEMPHWIIPHFAKLGLGGVSIEIKYGGEGYSHYEQCAILY